MTTTTQTAATVQVYRVYIKATPQRVWDAITEPEWNQRYGYGAPSEYELRPGGAYRSTASDEMLAYGKQMGFPVPEVIGDGEVLECDPPRRLVQTWRLLMDEAAAAEGFTRLTYEIAEVTDGVSRLTVTHDLTGAPNLAALVSGAREDEPEGEGAGGGWSWVLSDLKSLIETGSAFTA